MRQFLTDLFSYLLIIPGAILCYAPMNEKIIYSKKRIILMGTGIFAVTAPIFAFAEYRLNGYENVIFFLYCLMMYFIYHRTLDTERPKSFLVFLTVMVWMSYSANLAVLIDYRIQPDGPTDTNLIGSGIQLCIALVMAALFMYPLRRFGSRVVNEFDDKRVWSLGDVVSLLFIVICMSVIPRKYETLYVNNVLLSYIFVTGTTFALHLLLCMIYYFIISGLVRSKKAEQENKLFAMRESHYMKQQRYIDENRKVRHDFKHTIRTLKELADKKDYDTLTGYIDQYFEALPENDTVTYCKNYAVNAVLNYYHSLAVQSDIDTNWKVDLPEDTPIKDVDLCSMIGNILENAIFACCEVPEKERSIQLSVVLRHGANLYIVATNSFSGKVKLKNERYISTHRDGSGIGLSSIESVAESYGGIAEFSHEDRTFYTNVMLSSEKTE